MNLGLTDLNWLAIGTTTIATFMLGGLWYTALSKSWIEMHGYTPEQVTRMKQLRPPPLFFGGMIAAYFILSLVMAALVTNLVAPSLINGALLGFLLWLGIALPIAFTAWLASDKRAGVYVIDLSYQLIFLVMCGAILGAWR
jgi:hypothetical protein